MLIYSIQLSELILVIKSVPIWFTHRAWDIKLDSKTFCMDNKHRIVLTLLALRDFDPKSCDKLANDLYLVMWSSCRPFL